ALAVDEFDIGDSQAREQIRPPRPVAEGIEQQVGVPQDEILVAQRAGLGLVAQGLPGVAHAGFRTPMRSEVPTQANAGQRAVAVLDSVVDRLAGLHQPRKLGEMDREESPTIAPTSSLSPPGPPLLRRMKPADGRDLPRVWGGPLAVKQGRRHELL